MGSRRYANGSHHHAEQQLSSHQLSYYGQSGAHRRCTRRTQWRWLPIKTEVIRVAAKWLELGWQNCCSQFSSDLESDVDSQQDSQLDSLLYLDLSVFALMDFPSSGWSYHFQNFQILPKSQVLMGCIRGYCVAHAMCLLNSNGFWQFLEFINSYHQDVQKPPKPFPPKRGHSSSLYLDAFFPFSPDNSSDLSL